MIETPVRHNEAEVAKPIVTPFTNADNAPISVAPLVEDLAQHNRDFYTKFYEREESDSSDYSRTSLVDRMHLIVRELEPGSTVVSLGAGKQILEKEYIRKYGYPMANMASMDIAAIPGKEMLAPGVAHFQSDGAKLPLGDETIDAAVSSMAFDFMPEEARAELFRTLKPGGKVALNLHHPSIVGNPVWVTDEIRRLSRQIEQSKRWSKSKGTKIAKKDQEIKSLRQRMHLWENGKLFDQPEPIVELFTESGFRVDRVEHAIDKEGYQWWEVDIHKPDVHPQPKVTSRQGEALLGHTRRQEIRAIEHNINARKEEIKTKEEERAWLDVYIAADKANGWDEDEIKAKQDRQEVVLFERRQLAGEQKWDRDQIRQYKKPLKPQQ